MNAQELGNLTVVALKRELKARNLPMTGNKSDLVRRLSAHLSSEGQQMLDSKGIGFIGELSKNESFTEAGTIGQRRTDTQDGKAMNEPKIQPPSDTLVTAVPAVESLKAPSTAQATPTPVTPAKPVSNENLNNGNTTAKTDIQIEQANIKATLTENERKILRAKKFNIPVVQTKQMRAERFGLVKQDLSEKPNLATHTTESSDILRKRAERFGLAMSTTAQPVNTAASVDNAEKLVQRSLRFGLDSSVSGVSKNVSDVKKLDVQNQSEALLKRKERFGSALSPSIISEDSIENRKRMRAERLGLKP